MPEREDAATAPGRAVGSDETEEDLLVRTGVAWLGFPCDHPQWPVSCGNCHNRCDAAQLHWERRDLNRAVEITIYVCNHCWLWGLVPGEAVAPNLDIWQQRALRAVKDDPLGALLPDGFSLRGGGRLPPDGAQGSEKPPLLYSRVTLLRSA